MQKLLFTLFAALIACGLFSFKKTLDVYENIFNQMGLDTEEAESYISGNLIGGSSSFPRTKIMASLALNKRADAVREMGNYIKAYVQSSNFLKEYETTRLELKPERSTDPLYQGEEEMAVYKKDLKRWQAEYPINVNDLLKVKLKEFLQRTGNIDYNAKLEKYGDKMIFSDPVLEAKDELWKACFRSGKPTVDAARSFAQQWLQELNRDPK